jgi:protease IV
MGIFESDFKVMEERRISFGKVFWPSLVAALIVSIVGIIIFFMGLGGLISSFSEKEPYEIEDQTVLHVTLEGEIGEKGDTKFSKTNLDFDKKIGLSDLLYGFEKAALDDKVKGLFIDISDLHCGYATAREIRNAINEFEKCGKFAVAYNSGELVTQKEYYVSSAANHNFGFPTSAMEFMGLGVELSFFKNTLDKLEVEMQVIRGKNNDFKSAVEPFFRENMSDSSRVQIERYLASIWLDIRQDISADRPVSVQSLDHIAENATIRRVEDAVRLKLVDGVKYRDEVIDFIRKKARISSNKDVKLEAFEKYAKKKFYEDQILIKSEEPNIAVILAEGDISVEGHGMTAKEVCKLFQDVRKNETIKTVVFRINSPGGSALASDEIWREVKLTNAVKKVIVSMGDVAASGGYYIAAPATTIFAEPTTITGSIGVFGVIPYTGRMLNNKLGLTFDRASTNKHAVMTTNRKLTDSELNVIQEEVDQIYLQFLGRVAEGRGMTLEKVNNLARGRVWTGSDALKIGLVDQLGGISDAINYAAKSAKINKKKILYYPEKKDDPILEMLEMLDDNSSVKFSSKTHLPTAFLAYLDQLKKLETCTGVKMKLPFEMNIK